MHIENPPYLQGDMQPIGGHFVSSQGNVFFWCICFQRCTSACGKHLLVDDPYLDIPAIALRELLENNRFLPPLCAQCVQLLKGINLSNQVATMAIVTFDDEWKGKRC